MKELIERIDGAETKRADLKPTPPFTGVTKTRDKLLQVGLYCAAALRATGDTHTMTREGQGIISFDAEKASRCIERAFAGFLADPADSDYQRGYLAGLLTLYREGLGKGANDDRLKLLDAQVSL